MAFHLYEDVWETTVTTGTGDVTCGGAVSSGAISFQPFSGQYADGDTMLYALFTNDTTEREFGVGTYHATPNTVSRTKVLRSSNAGALVNFAAGTKQLMVAPIGVAMELFLQPDASGIPRAPWDKPTRIVTSGATATLAHDTDYLLVINKSVGSATQVNLPAAPVADWRFEVKDGKGDAVTNNITIVPGAMGTAATNAATASGSAVLNFASVPAFVVAGQFVTDNTTSGVIPAGTTVVSTTATTVTLSANATGGGVLNGDSIAFSPPIDGAQNFVLGNAHEAIAMTFDSFQWEIT